MKTWTRSDTLGVVVSLAVIAAWLARHRQFFHDDAFISLRYARNLADHGELAWNLGERIEGYTNFLHVMAAAGLIWLGLSPEFAVRLLNAAAATALVIIVARAALAVAPSPEMGPVRALFTVAAAATPAIAIWVLGGLEAVVAAAFLAGGLLALLIAVRDDGGHRALWAAAVAFALAVLTRPDSAVFIAGAGLGLLIAGSGPPVRRLGAAALVVGFPAAIAFAHMGWRYWFYGELLPLTFYAKADLDGALRLAYLPQFLGTAAISLPVVFLALAAIALAVATGRMRRWHWVLATPLGLQSLYVLWSGADHMPAARVLVPLIAPATLVLLALGLSFSAQAARVTGALCLVLTAAVALIPPPLKMDRAAYVGALVGWHITETWPKGSLIALSTAGSTPFMATENRYIDMLGLNDPVIAKREDVPVRTDWQRIPGHAKGDGAYVLGRRPDFIILGPANGTTADDPWFLSDVELAELDGFRQCYRRGRDVITYGSDAALPGPPGLHALVFTYYRRICS